MAGQSSFPLVSSIIVSPPSGFPWTPPITVWRDGTQFMATDVSAVAPPITGTTYYVGFSGASDSNDGLTQATSLNLLATALAKPGVGTIYVMAGLYNRFQSSTGIITNQSVRIIGVGGRATLSAHEAGLVWTYNSGAATYKATRSQVLAVWDAAYANGLGDYMRYLPLTSIAAVDATPGSWYDDGTFIYVRCFNNRIPDSNIRPYLQITLMQFQGACTIWLENIDLEGGALQALATDSTHIPRIYAKRCRFKYAPADNAVSLQGALSYLQECEAAHAYSDGFNYHAVAGINCYSVEWNCVGRDTGYSLGNINNGSTTHEANTIVRVGTQAYRTNGPGIVDVGGAWSWCVGCTSRDSWSTISIENADFWHEGNVPGTPAGAMWLDTCSSLRSVSTYNLKVHNGGQIYTRNFLGPSRYNIETVSQIVGY